MAYSNSSTISSLWLRVTATVIQRREGAPEHTRAFRSRRAVNWLTLGFTYSAMYMGRYNLSFANKALSSSFGWDKTQIGAIITTALTIYGFSAIFNGPIADKIGGRRAMLIGSIGTVVFNFLFGLGAYFGFLGTGTFLLGYFATVWGMNSYFQSYSALALIKVNAGWFHIKERGVFSAIFGSMIQSGRALIFIIGGIVVTLLPWQWVFFIPAAIVAVMAFLTYRFVRNNPEDCGLPELDVQDASSGDVGKVTVSYVLKKVLTNPVTLTIAVAEFCTGVVRHGFEQWFPRYMIEAQHLSLESAVFQKGALSVVLAGIAGAFAAGMMSDWIFKGRRTPVACLGYFTQIICLYVIWRAPSMSMVISAFVLNSFAISIVHSMLSGTASMDFGGKKAAATAAGIFDGMQYLGGSVVGIGMGYMLDHLGWGSWGPSMIGFSAIGAVLMIVLWNARPKTNAAH
ncbi:MAG: MFS transporter [Deltaproteobacteria bacterium]|nr:MFS transporter [Deltaproteobacteria bacterium]MBI3295502.1 MFS transporter [Deltaproteobacteria bacterium]